MSAQVKAVRWPARGRIPIPANRCNAHVLRQLEIAYKAIEQLTARYHATVIGIDFGSALPTLRLQMRLSSVCLPNTIQIRRPCELGMETIRRATFEGCRVEWSIGSEP